MWPNYWTLGAFWQDVDPFVWDRMNLLLRVDTAILGLLLVCTAVLVVRVSRGYRFARHGAIDSPTGKRVVAQLKAHVGNLKSITTTATYFGLLGTCIGVLNAFGPAAMERHAFQAWVISQVAAALVPCAAGIIVAIAATCGLEYGRTRLDLLVNGMPNRNRLPTQRFQGSPSFAVITTAWLLALLLRVYALPFAPLHTSKGYVAGTSLAPCDKSDRVIVLRISDRGRAFLNLQEEQNWTSLQSRLSEIYKMRENRVLYLSADEGVPFQTVADAIDAVRSAPEDITVQVVTPGLVNAGCPERRLVGCSAPHSSR